jgi:hypothetical protein
MRSDISAAIDRHLETLVVVWSRRRWPALRLVPAQWIRPVVAPIALRLRRLLALAILAMVMLVGINVAVLILRS